MTLVYAVILMTGVIGNICTCIVIARNRYMHTATNYYLFSLAVSDLLLLILGLPQELYQLWYKYPYIFGEAFCILRGLTSEMSTNASILTITAFTVERYVAICHPFRAQTMSHLPRAVKTILCIWTVAALCALPTALQFGIKYETDDNGDTLWDTAVCAVIKPLPHTFEISTCLFFVLPIILISVLYVLIGIRLRQGSIGNRADNLSNCNFISKQKMNSRKAVVKMLSHNEMQVILYSQQKLFLFQFSSPDFSSLEQNVMKYLDIYQWQHNVRKQPLKCLNSHHPKEDPPPNDFSPL
ncbi:Neuromedin-U receptor 2, partial [Stegodyphus mimosarum]